MKSKKMLILMFLIVVSGFALCGQEPVAKSAEEFFVQGLQHHENSIKNDSAATDSAIEAFTKSLELKQDSVVKAYLGSSWTLKGRDAVNPIAKIDYVLKGCKLIDEAVDSDPDNVITRRLRIENYDSLPDIFEKEAIVDSDLNYLIALYIKNPKAFEDTYDPAFCFYYYGSILIKKGEMSKGKKYLKAAKKIVVDNELKEKINLLLGE